MPAMGVFSSHKWVNNLFGYTLNALGGNEFFWRQKHNIIHHTYPNIDGMDDDIAKSPLIRQCETQKWLASSSCAAYLSSPCICHYIYCMDIHYGFCKIFFSKDCKDLCSEYEQERSLHFLAE